MSDDRPRITRRRWTAAEDATVRDLFGRLPATDLAERLGRTVDSLRVRARILKLSPEADERRVLRDALTGLRASAAPPDPAFATGSPIAAPPLPQPTGHWAPRKTFISMSTAHGYFTRVATAEQAYILGLLAADGNVQVERPRVHLSLQLSDGHVVAWVRDRLNPAMPVSIAKAGATILLTSRQMVADLAAHGIVPRKSRTLAWPSHLGDLQRPYLLGYFDGDGSMYLPKDRRGRERPGWTACSGSEQFLADMRNYIREATGVEAWKIQRRAGANLWQVAVTGLGATVLNAFLHQDGLGMERKRLPEAVIAPYLE